MNKANTRESRARRRSRFIDRLSTGESRSIYGTIEYSGKTTIQRVKVLSTVMFGNVLILDNEIQLSEADQEIYHQHLVQPGLDLLKMIQSSPIHALVFGGADGYALGHLTRDVRVETITLVDHDAELVRLFATGSLGTLFGTASAFCDDRVRIQSKDVLDYVRESLNPDTNLVIIDLTDDWLRSKSAVAALQILASDKLRQDVIISINAGTEENTVKTIRQSGLQVLENWSIPIRSFGDPWQCVLASRSALSLVQERHLACLRTQWPRSR